MISRTLKSLTARMRHHCQNGGASVDQSWELLHRMEAVTKDAEAMEESLKPLNSLSPDAQERRGETGQGDALTEEAEDQIKFVLECAAMGGMSPPQLEDIGRCLRQAFNNIRVVGGLIDLVAAQAVPAVNAAMARKKADEIADRLRGKS